MSHNKIKVAGQGPDASGNIALSSVTIGDLNNVTITNPSADQVILYDSASSLYINGSSPSGPVEYMLLGQGESNAYSNSGASSLSTNSTLMIYDTSPLNTITGASFGTAVNNWYPSVVLPSGKYSILAQANVEFSASGYFAAGFESSSSPLGAQMVIGDNAGSYIGGSNTCINSYFELSSTTTCNIKIKAASNVETVANQANTIAEFTSILVMKLAT